MTGSLTNMQDILEPVAVPFWPLAPGAWILIILLVLWAGIGFGLLFLNHRKNLYRRLALSELAEIHGNCERTGKKETIMAVASLLKRVALTAFRRERVASLTGQEWYGFLSTTMGTRSFSQSSGQLLTTDLHQSSEQLELLSEKQLKELFIQAEVWIKKHKPENSNEAQPNS